MQPSSTATGSGPGVVAHIQGGLGNQLFCYAAARALALRNGVPIRINTRDGFRREKYGRDCLLRHLCIEAPEAGWWAGFRGPLGRWRRSWARRWNRARPLEQRSLLQEPADQSFDPAIRDLAVRGPVYLVGYWQHEEYFADAAATLREEFRVRSPEVARAAGEVAAIDPGSDAVSLHCRSYGEVTNLKDGIRLGAEYYAKALDAIAERVPGAQVFCFSDDPAWAQDLLESAARPGAKGGALPVTFISTPAEDATRATLIDFTLMSRCKHHVVANSSFSWWTAWLGEQGDSVVVAPATGLLADGARFPERWIKVEA
ncbi:MAG: alpha-1,2-fucosyltransferase [Akkermansiaceae bacterium]|nr:alpha-1,2-fucosyltransferase [Akkermansiaceae bacterium]NNM29427.1 alpha-1,2-fucosyltransferase [Akkermansiaceae bacterium]